METRQMTCAFKTRAEGDEKKIEGYFAVFGGRYEIAPDMYETIDPHAFDTALNDDIRALTNHDTTLVLGRNKASTLALSVDEHGLFGSILINPNDAAAVNLYVATWISVHSALTSSTKKRVSKMMAKPYTSQSKE